MDQGKTIVRNVFSNWTSYAVGTLVMLFLTPFVIHKLGNTGYGIWILALSFTGQLGVLDLGLRPIIVKFIAKYLALEDYRKINEIINTTMVAFSAIAGLIILASLVMSYYSDRLFVVGAEYQAVLKTIIILTGLNVAVSFPFGVFNAVIHAFQRFDLRNICAISITLVRSLFIWIFLEFGGGLISLAIIVLVARALEFVLNYFICRRIYPALKIDLRMAGRKTLKMIYSFSIYTFIIGIAIGISFQMDSIIIGAFMSAGAITFYAIANNLIDYLTQIISLVSVTLTPVASALDAQKRQEKLRELLVVGTRYTLLVLLPFGLAFLVLGKTFIDLWMGDEYGSVCSPVLIILMLSYFGYLSQMVAGSIFFGLGKVRNLSFMILGAALANLALSIILVKPYGIIGVALGTAIPLVIYASVIHPIYICRLLHQDYLQYLRVSYLPPLVVSLPYLAALLALERFVAMNSLVTFFLLMTPATLVYAVSVFFFAVMPEHRKTILEKVRSLTFGPPPGSAT